jgi:DNA-directed RNA polymerase subunit N (RpoN/RPB10)
MTRYGEQEGSAVGYNPQKRGRRSHHPIIAFVADLRQSRWYFTHNGLKNVCKINKVLLSETMSILGKHRIGLLRADAGFFDGTFLDYVELNVLQYIIAVKMNRILKEKIVSPSRWLKLDDGIDVAEFEYQAQSWSKLRRIIVVRQLVKERPQAGGKYLFDMHDYRYQAYSTNLTLPPAEVWRLYRGRADSENRIEELKYDFGLDSFCLDQFYATEAAFRSVMVSYNVISLFRQAVLGVKIQPRLATIRFQCFAIGSWIGRKYRKNVLRVSLAHKRRPWFEGLFTKIEDFSWDLPVEPIKT